MAQYRYNYTGPQRGRQDRPPNRNAISWVAIILLLCFVPPVGVLLLFLKLFSGSRTAPRGRHPQDQMREQGGPVGARTAPDPAAQAARPDAQAPSAPQAPMVNPNAASGAGKNLIKVGAVLTAIFGFCSLIELVDSLYYWPNLLWILEDTLPLLCFLGGGLGLLLCGLGKQKKARRYRKYLALIGKRTSISISSLAEAMPASPATVRKDLEDMLDTGYFPVGYLDYGDDELVLSGEGLQDDPEPAKQEEAPQEKEDAILAEIRSLKASISQPQLAEQIERIEEITAKIFDYQKAHPEKASQLRTFLSYYLPATLKILHAYDRLESQGVEGENISSAMDRIEAMMSKVVEGFEKQLDQLFQDDAMDITPDVAVLERMLAKDGLSSGDGLQLGL